MYENQTKSRTSLQKLAKKKAYEVIRRSNAWSALLKEKYPEALRLSIHPQGCGSEKFGIRLLADETWMTPWHGVATKTLDGFILLKRYEAEKLGGDLVLTAEGKASHFKIDKSIAALRKALAHES